MKGCLDEKLAKFWCHVVKSNIFVLYYMDVEYWIFFSGVHDFKDAGLIASKTAFASKTCVDSITTWLWLSYVSYV